MTMREYIKPEIDIYYDIKLDDALLQASDALLQASQDENAGVDEDQLSKGQYGAIFDIEDEDEDDLFYMEYAVKW